MSADVIKTRLDKLRAKLIEKELDAALITKRENYLYFSGFTGSFAILVVTKQDAVLMTDFRYMEQASKQAPLYEIVEYKNSQTAGLNEILIARNIKKLGFEDSNLTYEKYLEFYNNLDVKKFIPLGTSVESIRMIKDRYEINTISKAVEIADNAFEHILNYLKPGVTELEIAAELEFKMKKLGAKAASFETIVASGKRSSMPHGVASEKKLEVGDTITMDFGAVFEDYCSDMTRTVFLGQPGKEMVEIYNTVLKAQMEGLNGAAAGLSGKEIDGVARKIIYDSGYEGKFGHGLGHGVGLEIHEEPRLSPSGSFKMEDGMVVTVEPGIYVNGLGGVRIEDMLVINGEKPIVLTKSPKNLIIL
ncbi:MAG TPA: aminopeptidase P family protein [Clostridia bacterium]|nr:aminopeptidase P family protein [Clostridia bacterium]